MVELSNLSTPANYKKKKSKRVGRGNGSNGTYSGRGCKGAKSRSGFKHKFGYEGGQMPLHRRVPKRGFTNIFKTEYIIFNIDDLERIFNDGDVVNKDILFEKGLIKKKDLNVKILGRGELTKKLEITADKISDSAAEKITAAGGSVKQ